MEVDFFAAMGSAASLLVEPNTLFYLLIGVGIGSLLSVVPGIGGLMGIALLLPFTFSMSSFEAMAFLLGAMAVMSTADSIPAILFGVPGTPTSMVTVLDGYPMSKKGQAGRALGAAFSSSVIGGVIGALLLLIIIPVIMPVLMRANSPELLAFCLLGLAMVGSLAGGSMAKGLGAAFIGVLLAFIGQDDNTATLRWTFETIYLWDGLHILIIALGIYAIPELADLAIQNKTIAGDETPKKMSGVRQGASDTLKNMWPVTRNSSISSFLGVIPAIGPAVIPWLVYSYTNLRTKGKKEFGKGDVRGVIASESANNATVGGSLLPTVALGVPGSAPMALLLGAMLLHGIAPGPNMLSTNLDMTYMMVWAIVLANVIGGLVALAMARPLSRVVFVRSTFLVPLISVVVFFGAVQSTRQWEDALFLVLVGILGWVMKRARWPRAPLFLAFILAPLVEKYFFISMNIHGWAWTLRPAVSVILAITAIFILSIVVSRFIKLFKKRSRITGFQFKPSADIDSLFTIFIFSIMAAAFYSASQWNYLAGIMPMMAAASGVFVSLLALLACWLHPVYQKIEYIDDEAHFDLETDFGELTTKDILFRSVKFISLLASFGITAWLFGLVIATPIYLLGYMLIMRESWKIVVPLTVGFCLFAYVVFTKLLNLPWPASVYPLLF